jgi:hypothetical protein
MPARVHRQNLLIKARKTSLVLGYNFRLEGPVPVARHFDLYRSEVSLHLFPASAIAVVPAAAPFRRVLLIAEVVIQLGIHRPLDQRLGQLLEQAVWPDNLLRALASQ